ncbi:MAG: hypothetical protein ABFD23_04035 [Caldisericales bacterium]|nr:hypothetical protein [bacterium]
MIDTINNILCRLRADYALSFLNLMRDDIPINIIEQSKRYYSLFTNGKYIRWLENEFNATTNPTLKREYRLLLNQFQLGKIEYNPEMSVLLDRYEVQSAKRIKLRSIIATSSNSKDFYEVHDKECELVMDMANIAESIIEIRIKMAKEAGFNNYSEMYHTLNQSDYKKWEPFFSWTLKMSKEDAKKRNEKVFSITGIENPWQALNKMQDILSSKLDSVSPISTLARTSGSLGLEEYFDKVRVINDPSSAWLNIVPLNPPSEIVIFMGNISKLDSIGALYHEFGHALSYMVPPQNYVFNYDPYLLESMSCIIDRFSNSKHWYNKYLPIEAQQRELFDLSSTNNMPDVVLDASLSSLVSYKIYSGIEWDQANMQVRKEYGFACDDKPDPAIFLSHEMVVPFFKLNYIIGLIFAKVVYHAAEIKYGDPYNKEFGKLLLEKFLKPGNSVAPRNRIWALLESLSFNGNLPGEFVELVDSLI